MKLNPTSLVALAFLLLVLASLGHAQDSDLNTSYLARYNETIFSTEPMFLENTSNQFMQITFSFRYSGRRMTKMPGRVSVEIWSASKELGYRKDTRRRLTIVADGKRLSSSETAYSVLRSGKDRFVSDNSDFQVSLPNGYQVSLPEFAQVKGSRLYLEVINIDFKSADLLKICAAKNIEFYLGGQKLNFDDFQIIIFCGFVRRLGS